MYLLKRIPIFFFFFFGGLFVIPLFTSSPYWFGILGRAAVFAIWAMSWDLFSGYTGEINFGSAAFIGSAGYIAGIMNTMYGTPPVYTIILCGLMMFIFALIMGVLTLRVKGPYFAIVTMAINIICVELTVAVFWKWTRAEEGIPSIQGLSTSPVVVYLLAIIFCCVVFLSLMCITLSKYGKILKSLRENETAAAASGINVTFYRVATLGLSGLLFGISGAFNAHMNLHVGIDQIDVFLSVTILMMTIFGGSGTIMGPLLGAYFMIVVSEFLRFTETHRMVIYTGIIFFTIFLMPQGIYPSAKDWMHRFIKERVTFLSRFLGKGPQQRIYSGKLRILRLLLITLAPKKQMMIQKNWKKKF